MKCIMYTCAGVLPNNIKCNRSISNIAKDDAFHCHYRQGIDEEGEHCQLHEQ